MRTPGRWPGCCPGLWPPSSLGGGHELPPSLVSGPRRIGLGRFLVQAVLDDRELADVKSCWLLAGSREARALFRLVRGPRANGTLAGTAEPVPRLLGNAANRDPGSSGHDPGTSPGGYGRGRQARPSPMTLHAFRLRFPALEARRVARHASSRPGSGPGDRHRDQGAGGVAQRGGSLAGLVGVDPSGVPVADLRLPGRAGRHPPRTPARVAAALTALCTSGR